MSKLRARFASARKADEGAESKQESKDHGFGRWYAQDTADALAAAFHANDWAGVRASYAALPSWEARLAGINAVEFDEEPVALNQYIKSTGENDSVALLLRGVCGVEWAWDARGDGWSDTVSAEAWDLFFERLRQADLDLHRAARLDPANPIPWIQMLVSARGLQLHKDEVELRFENLFRREPASVSGHSSYLQTIAGKWSGSNERMWRFALDVHEHVPDGSPLKTVVPEAYVERFVVAKDDVVGDPFAAVAAAADSSIFHADFKTHDPLEQSHALTWFATAFHFLKDEGRGAQAVRMIGDRPSEWGLHYLPGRKPKKQWANLQKSFNVRAAA